MQTTTDYQPMIIASVSGTDKPCMPRAWRFVVADMPAVDWTLPGSVLMR